MNQWYKEDLAYIHDIGFQEYAVKSAPGILEILDRHKIRDGLIVDLGCGTGHSAQAFVAANYRVLGVDISPSAIEIAHRRVPEAEFRVASLFEVKIPPCMAVISIGECFNYCFDGDRDLTQLVGLFDRIYRSLAVGGVFVFDIAEPGIVPPGTTAKGFTEGEDWIVLVEKEEDSRNATLTRRIITFRQMGENYRRAEELHVLRLYHAREVVTHLRRIGFEVEILRGYGSYRLPLAHAAIVAYKPSPTASRQI